MIVMCSILKLVYFISLFHSVQLLVRDLINVTQLTIHEETSLETVGILPLDSFLALKGIHLHAKDVCIYAHKHDLSLALSHYSDVQCGQLHCAVGDFQQTADVSVTILTVSVFNPSTRNIDRCR